MPPPTLPAPPAAPVGGSAGPVAPPAGPSWAPPPTAPPTAPPPAAPGPASLFPPDPRGAPAAGAPPLVGGAAGGPPSGPARPSRTPPFARPTRLITVLVAVVAVAFDLAAHQRLASLAATSFVGVAVVALVVSGRIRNRQALGLGCGAVVIALFLSLRSSPWLVPLDVIAAAGLLVLTAGYATGGSVSSLTGSSLVRRGGRFLVSTFLAPSYAFGCIAAWVPARSEQRRQRLVAVARGIGLAVPVVVVLALLLASADAVFASLFSLPTDVGSVLGHVGLIGLGVIVASALFVEASSSVVADTPLLPHAIGPTESSVVLGAIAVLYAAFAVVQVVTARGGAGHVIETAGLTYADHAREGFFQLLAVAAITLAVVGGLRVVTAAGTRRQQVSLVVLSEVVVALTLVILAVALDRLRLYEGAYGATMLRLACTAFAWWLAAVFVLVAVVSAGIGRRRSWIGGAVVLSALVGLVGWNLVNPEQLVVERNLAMARSGERELDVGYLWLLSDDAVPAMAASLPTAPPGDRGALLERICKVPVWERPPASRRAGDPADRVTTTRWVRAALVPGAGAPGGPEAPTGLAANRSASQAAAARAEVCPA